VSDALYSTRLRCMHGRGVARLHGRSVELVEAPVLGGVAVHHVDYTPEVSVIEIQRRACDPRVEMTAGEIADADRLLRRLVPW
jgi:hypothetical protein